MTVGFGTFMYLVPQRRRLRAAVMHVAPAPALEREPRGATVGRAATVAIVQATTLVAIAFAFRAVGFATVDTFAIFAGIGAGGGLTLLFMARWLRAWKRVHHEHVLSEASGVRPPWRWRLKIEWTTRPLVLYADGTPAIR